MPMVLGSATGSIQIGSTVQGVKNDSLTLFFGGRYPSWSVYIIVNDSDLKSGVLQSSLSSTIDSGDVTYNVVVENLTTEKTKYVSPSLTSVKACAFLAESHIIKHSPEAGGVLNASTYALIQIGAVTSAVNRVRTARAVGTIVTIAGPTVGGRTTVQLSRTNAVIKATAKVAALHGIPSGGVRVDSTELTMDLTTIATKFTHVRTSLHHNKCRVHLYDSYTFNNAQAEYDTFYQNCIAHSLTPVFDIYPGNNYLFGTPTDHYVPITQDAQAIITDFVTRLALRYPLAWFEITNEPNLVDFWMPAVNATDYGDVANYICVAIRAANPSAYTIVGGTAANRPIDNEFDITFMTTAFARINFANVSAVSIHPYTQVLPAIFDAQWVLLLNLVASSAGRLLPIIASEVGFNREWSTFNASKQAQYTGYYYTYLNNRNIMPIWYTWDNSPYSINGYAVFDVFPTRPIAVQEA